MRRHRRALAHRRTNDDRVLHDGRRRVDADLAGLQIDLLPLADDGADFEIDHAVLAERRDRRAGLRVELDKAVPGRHVDDAVVALAVGPVRHAAAGKLARRDGGAVAFPIAVRPDQLAGAAVDRHDRAARARRAVEDAFDRERRAFELELRPRAEVVRLEAPRDFELVEVARRDLIER